MARKSKQEASNLRSLNEPDLNKELEDAYRQLFTIRLQLSTRQLANTSQPSKVRRKIARIKTLKREQQLAAQQESGS